MRKENKKIMKSKNFKKDNYFEKEENYETSSQKRDKKVKVKKRRISSHKKR